MPFTIKNKESFKAVDGVQKSSTIHHGITVDDVLKNDEIIVPDQESTINQSTASHQQVSTSVFNETSAQISSVLVDDILDKDTGIRSEKSAFLYENNVSPNNTLLDFDDNLSDHAVKNNCM